MKIGEMLIQDGIITEEQLDTALEIQKKQIESEKIGEILIKNNYLSLEKLVEYIDKQLGDL